MWFLGDGFLFYKVLRVVFIFVVSFVWGDGSDVGIGIYVLSGIEKIVWCGKSENILLLIRWDGLFKILFIFVYLYLIGKGKLFFWKGVCIWFYLFLGMLLFRIRFFVFWLM